MNRVYLFQENNLLVPEELDDEEALSGIDRKYGLSFGDLDYYTVPSLSSETDAAAALLGPEARLPPSWRALPVRQAAALLSVKENSLPAAEAGQAARLFRIFHLLQWRKDSRYCGSCGAPNGDSPEELARLCPRCGRVEYPRISPAVIVLVTRDDGTALLAHNKKFRDGLYSLIAGFAEAGESLEAAAIREIREEVHITVRDLCYTASQGWPFPNSLMAGFTARYAAGELRPDGKEITDARWFSRRSVEDGVPEIPSRGSVSRYIIDNWLAGSFHGTLNHV